MDFQEDAYEDLFEQQSYEQKTPQRNQAANDYWPIEGIDERAVNNLQ